MRIKLRNFKAIRDLEMFPGARLNFLVGPNGAGKSSIIESLFVCLGSKSYRSQNVFNLLQGTKSWDGFMPKIRSANLTTVEVEFKSEPRNVVVRLTMTRKNENDTNPKRSWVIDGREAECEEVYDLAQGFGVQLENLCQFLPQFRVEYFSKLNPQQRLDETLRDIDQPGLFAAKEEMQKLYEAEKDAASRETRARQQLEQETAQLMRMEDARLAHEERQQLEKHEAELNLVVVLIEHQLAKEHDDAMLAQKAELAKTSAELSQAKERAQQCYARLQTELDQLTEGQKSLIANVSASEQSLRKLFEGADGAARDLRAALEARDDLARDIAERQVARAKLQAQVASLENELAQLADEDQLNGRAVHDREAKKAVSDEMADIASQKASMAREREALDSRVRQLQLRKQSFKSTRERRLDALFEALRTSNNSKLGVRVRDSLAWLQANGPRLSGRVWGPIAVELNVADPFLQCAVENAFAFEELTALIFDSKADQLLYAESMSRKGQLDSYTTTSGAAPLVPVMHAERAGVDGFLSDVVECDAAVLQVLCQWKMLHLRAFVRSHDEPEAALRTLVRADKRSSVTNLDSIYSIYISRFAGGGDTISIEQLRQGASFICEADGNDSELRDVEVELGRIERAVADVTNRRNALHERDVDTRKRLDAIVTSINNTRSERDSRTKIVNKLASVNRDLADAEPINEATERVRLAKKLSNALTKRMATVKAYTDELERLAGLRSNLMSSCLPYAPLNERVDEANREFGQAQARCDAITGELERVEQACMASKATVAKWRVEFLRLAKAHGMAKDNAALEARMTEHTRDFDTYRDALRAKRAELDMTRARLSVVRTRDFDAERYEQLKASVAQLKARLDDADRLRHETEDAMEARLADWVASVRALIRSIDTHFAGFFRSMDCTGEVELIEAGHDLAAYGIAIKVSFHAGQPLQALSKERQSGGERAVSTILYLIAMQEHSPAPFRIVDEINQGMDPKYERCILERVIERATRPNAPQSFYVTPKLLYDLPFVPETSFHCVFSGAHMESQEGMTRASQHYLK